MEKTSALNQLFFCPLSNCVSGFWIWTFDQPALADLLQEVKFHVLLSQISCSLYENSQDMVFYMLVKFHKFWGFLAIPNSSLNTGVN